MADSIYLQRRYSKMKGEGASIPLNPIAKQALVEWVSWSGAYMQEPTTWLFPPTKGSYSRKPLYLWGEPVHDKSVRKCLDRLKKLCFITGRVSTHSMRKTFAKVMYDTLEHDIMATQKALRHKNIGSTLCSLQVNENAVQKAIVKGFSSFAPSGKRQ